jgi:hypothetical protein
MYEGTHVQTIIKLFRLSSCDFSQLCYVTKWHLILIGSHSKRTRRECPSALTHCTARTLMVSHRPRQLLDGDPQTENHSSVSGSRWEFYLDEFVRIRGPPLWSSGQSSWLQIRRPGFDSRHYQIFRQKRKRKTSSGSGTGSAQPREYNWGATW